MSSTAIVATRSHALVASDGRVARRPIPDAGTIDSLSAMLDRASFLFGPNGSGSIVVAEPGALKRYRDQRDQLGTWEMIGAGMTAWTTYRRKDPGGGRQVSTVHLGVLDELDATRNLLFPLDDDPTRIAWRLGWYHAHTRAPWHMTAGVSGCASVRALSRRRDGRQPYWGVGSRRPIGDDRSMAGDIVWERPVTKTEAAMRFVHAFDLAAARLAAANVADVPWSRLEHTGPAAFDRDLGGYWQVHRAELPATTRMAPPLVPPGAGPLVWLTTPLMSELCRAGHNPEVVDSYTADCKRWLLPWARVIDTARRRAIESGDDWLIAATKATYKETFGMFDREGGSVFLPIGAHTVIDRQRVTVIGHIKRGWHNAQRWPVKVLTDCLYYASDCPDPAIVMERLGLPYSVDSRIGYFTLPKTKTIPMAEWLNGKRR